MKTLYVVTQYFHRDYAEQSQLIRICHSRKSAEKLKEDLEKALKFCYVTSRITIEEVETEED